MTSAEYKRKWRASRKELEKEVRAAYRLKNKERIKMKQLEYDKANPEKLKIRQKRWNLKNPEIIKYNNYIGKLKKYGLTPQEYDGLYNKQDGKCKICGIHQSELKFRLSIDHKHVEGYEIMSAEDKKMNIRGLLCSNCNSMLGHCKDNIQILQNGIQYLKENQ